MLSSSQSKATFRRAGRIVPSRCNLVAMLAVFSAAVGPKWRTASSLVIPTGTRLLVASCIVSRPSANPKYPTFGKFDFLLYSKTFESTGTRQQSLVVHGPDLSSPETNPRPFKLVIVESPSKCKTIAKILKDYVNENQLEHDYVVTSCMGHIRNLPKQKTDRNQTIAGIELENGYQPGKAAEESFEFRWGLVISRLADHIPLTSKPITTYSLRRVASERTSCLRTEIFESTIPANNPCNRR